MSDKETYPEAILNETLDKISNHIKQDIDIYLIGGGAMIYYGRKAATKDIDIVFTDPISLEYFIDAATKAGLYQVTPTLNEYKNLGTWVILRAASGIQLDLFNKKVCNALTVQESVTQRAVHHKDINRLHIYLMSPEDIVLFKGITERESDLEDIRILAESSIDWNIVEEECLTQENSETWANLLLSKLVTLKARYGINPPLRKLRAHADAYVLIKSFELFLGDKELTFNQLKEIVKEKTNYSPTWTRNKLKELEKIGLIISRKEGRNKKYKINKGFKPH